MAINNGIKGSPEKDKWQAFIKVALKLLKAAEFLTVVFNHYRVKFGRICFRRGAHENGVHPLISVLLSLSKDRS